MDTKTIALQLGLAETATEAEITAKLGELKAAKEQNETLIKEKDALTLAAITTLVDRAIAEKRLAEENKQQFIDLGKEIGAEKLEATLKAMSPQVKITEVLGHQGGAPTGPEKATFTKLSEVPPTQLMKLRDENPVEYKRLYKAEYGIECEF